MKTEKFKGTIESAYGSPLATALKFDGEFEAYADYDEAAAANDLPSRDEQVTFVNNRRKANARQKSMQAALDAAGVAKPVADETPEGKIVAGRVMVKQLVATGFTEANARQLIETTLGISLA